MIPLETPAQLRAASNLAHWTEGLVLIVLGLIAIVEARGGLKSCLGRFLWPGVITAAGGLLPVFMLFRRGFANLGLSWREIVQDQQQIQHLWLAAILVAAGVVEISRRAEWLRSKSWGLAVPAGLILLGSLLWVHVQYGTPEAVAEALLWHRLQGAFLILAGFLMGSAVVFPARQHWLTFGWIFSLFLSSLLLLAYREPQGAYETPRKISLEDTR